MFLVFLNFKERRGPTQCVANFFTWVVDPTPSLEELSVVDTVSAHVWSVVVDPKPCTDKRGGR